jgi:diguanylate cyclase (GGDEF)-like protein/PAS domain S-box-containing protein
MDLLPVARSHLIENMSDGVLVVDAKGRIVDINRSMLGILKGTAASFLGRHVSDVMKGWAEMSQVIGENDATRTEIRLQHDSSRYLDLRMTPIFDEKDQLSGRIIVSRDITERKQVEKDLVYANDRLHTQLIEIGLLQEQLREQAIRDPLTNLFNRRYLDETLERELARAEREKYPLCIVMMDLDHFKDVNDVYGHEAGDVVLRSLAEKVVHQCRHGDFVCRYGGEEFVLVMPNICLDVTSRRARELHQNIEGMNIPYGRFNLSTTISMGIACYPTHGTTKGELLRAADKALYRAKHSGRNCVTVYDDIQSIG